MPRFRYRDLRPLDAPPEPRVNSGAIRGRGRSFGLECAIALMVKLQSGHTVRMLPWAEEMGISYKQAKRILEVLAVYVPIVDVEDTELRQGGRPHLIVKLMQERRRG